MVVPQRREHPLLSRNELQQRLMTLLIHQRPNIRSYLIHALYVADRMLARLPRQIVIETEPKSQQAAARCLHSLSYGVVFDSQGLCLFLPL